MFRTTADYISFLVLVLTGLLPATLRADGPRRIYSLADLDGPAAAASISEASSSVAHAATDSPAALSSPTTAGVTDSPSLAATPRRPAAARASLARFNRAADDPGPALAATDASARYVSVLEPATAAAELPLYVMSCRGGTPIVMIIEEVAPPAAEGGPSATRRFGAWLQPEQEGRTARQFFELGLFRDPPWYGWYGPYWFGYRWGAYRPWGFGGGYYGPWFPRYYGAYGGAYPFGYSPVWYAPRGYAPPAGNYGRVNVF